MLRTLTIRDVVLIERLDLTFGPDLSVLTGETGAGKSILLDALGLALGARADSALVRPGAERALVTAEFDPEAAHPAWALLARHGLDASGDALILRRMLAADGRSRAFVNDQPVSVAALREIGEALVDIHGQFENQRLLDPATHRVLLDAYGGLAPLVERTGGAHQAWREAAATRARAAVEFDRARRDEEFLRHAAGEIAALAPAAGEEAALARQRQVMMMGEKLIEALRGAATELGEGRGAEAAVAAAVRHLRRVADKAQGRFDAAIAALERTAAELADGQALLAKASREIDLDPRHLEQVEERLFALRGLARKHGVETDALPALGKQLEARLTAVEDGGAAVARLTAVEAERRRDFLAAAEALSQARRAAAARLDGAVAQELAPLRLGQAKFSTRIEPLPESAWGETGCDRVAFEVVTNPGMPAGPLSRISSGGELARFMLALKVVLAGADPLPTIVFDEVDNGVGGAVAAAVGERLVRLAEDFQVLVVTHSPQVAARGAHHWRVSKLSAPPGTLTTVDALSAAARLEEIARMLAGATITDEARAAAGRLLEVGSR